MTLEQYSYLAEILGTATVVVSLIYLALQVKHGIAQGQAEARYAFVQATSDINMTIAQNRELASVWRRGLEDPNKLDSDERMQLWMLMGQYCNAWMVMHQPHKECYQQDISCCQTEDDRKQNSSKLERRHLYRKS